MADSPYKAIIRVSVWEVRKIFNEDRFMERAGAKQLRMEVKRSKEVDNAKIRKVRNWIPGTLSEMLKFYDSDGVLVAKAHRYLRPDGKLAASGMADPQRVVRDGIMHIMDGPDPDEEEV